MNDGYALAFGSLPRVSRASPAGESAPPLRLSQAERLERAVLREVVEQLHTRERLRAEWTALVVHELRRTLTTIDLCAQLLQEEALGLGAGARERLGHVRRGIEELSRMTSDLLDASSIEARAMTVQLMPVQLATLVRDAIAHLPDLAERCRLHVEPGADVCVNADARRLEQVLGNLLENAAKYATPETQIDVDLAVRGSEARVTVSSRGPGIASDRLSRIFDRFARSPEARKEKPGLGLGLYIAKGLIEAHGGRIWAKSAQGISTQFYFTVPVATP